MLEKDFGWLQDVVRANKPKRLPTVFTPEEAAAVIAELAGVRWLMGMQLYGGGLRLMECLRLRVKDLDFVVPTCSSSTASPCGALPIGFGRKTTPRQ